MATAGMAAIELAKKSSTWAALDDVDNSIVPDDLQAALDRNKTAKEYFDSFPKSSKKIILEWIQSAKRAETRQKRISETVALAEKNQRANHYRQ
jgi:uncharacterized protein YdeI (YjbR/CyaY-like superfamily)